MFTCLSLLIEALLRSDVLIEKHTYDLCKNEFFVRWRVSLDLGNDYYDYYIIDFK